MRKALIVVSSILFIALMVLPCANVCAPAAAPGGKEPVRIGALESMTGDIAFWGPDSIVAVNLALDEWNHEVAGRPIEFYYEDDGSTDAVMALDHAKKLVEADKVNVILQPSCSGPFIGMRDYCNANGIVTIGQGWRGEFVPYSLSQQVIGISPDQRYDICSPTSAAQIDYAVGQWLYKEKGVKTVATIGHDYETGYQTCGSFADGFTKAGGTVVQQQWAPFGTVDFAPFLSALKPADMTATWFTGPMQPLIVKQYHEFGLDKTQPMIQLLNDSFYEPDFAELGDWLEGMYVVTEFPSGSDNPTITDYVTKYLQKAGKFPDPCVGFGAYVATNIYLETVKALNGNTDGKAVRDYILSHSYQTLKGTMAFTNEGYAKGDAYVGTIQKKVCYATNGVLTVVPVKTLSDLTYPGYYTKP
jgi:branched-chain amino acid transport system substrate-binding protein